MIRSSITNMSLEVKRLSSESENVGAGKNAAKAGGPPPSKAAFKFSGEKAEPVSADVRHSAMDTTYLEVSPEQLIDVARHLAGKGLDHQEAVTRAYAIICEAHLVSRNIQLWNEKVRRHHSAEHIFSLVNAAPTNEQGQPLRVPLLVEFFKARGQGSNATNASKRFNEWFRHSTRLNDYLATVPWNREANNFDPELHKQLLKTGWITWFQIGSSGYLLLPSQTLPAKKAPRKPEEGEHMTRPFWVTNDVWWPQANPKEVERRKSEYLNQARDAFSSPHMATRALEKFERWLDLEEAIQRETNPPSPVKRPRSGKGEFVSPRNKGADRGEKGRFRKKSGS